MMGSYLSPVFPSVGELSDDHSRRSWRASCGAKSRVHDERDVLLRASPAKDGVTDDEVGTAGPPPAALPVQGGGSGVERTNRKPVSR